MATIINGDGIVTAEGTSTTQGRLRLGEDTDNGTNYVELTAPAALGANRTVTFPDADMNFATGLSVSQGGTGATTLTANNVILGNGTSAVQFVAPGTNGNVLTSNGTTWTSSAPATGALVFLNSVSASASTNVDFDNFFTSAYDNYMVIINALSMSTGVQLLWRALIGGVAQTDANYSFAVPASGATTTGATSGRFSDFGAAPANLNFEITIQRPLATANKAVKGEYISMAGTNDPQILVSRSGYGGSTAAWSGIRFFANSGTITGTFRLYGIRNS